MSHPANGNLPIHPSITPFKHDDNIFPPSNPVWAIVRSWTEFENQKKVQCGWFRPMSGTLAPIRNVFESTSNVWPIWYIKIKNIWNIYQITWILHRRCSEAVFDFQYFPYFCFTVFHLADWHWMHVHRWSTFAPMIKNAVFRTSGWVVAL